MGQNLQNKKIMKLVLLGIGIIVAAVVIIVVSAYTQNTKKAEDAKNETAEAAEMANAEAVTVKPILVDGSDESANKIFACKVGDISDSAAIVKLLEAIEMEKAVGEYTVEVKKNVMVLETEQPVKSGDEARFNANMQVCSLQLLALIPELNEVKWTYSLSQSTSQSTEAESESGKEEKDSDAETITKSLDESGATELAGADIRSFGKNAEALQKLLVSQMTEAEQPQRSGK